jgi:hypothetical protein
MALTPLGLPVSETAEIPKGGRDQKLAGNRLESAVECIELSMHGENCNASIPVSSWGSRWCNGAYWVAALPSRSRPKLQIARVADLAQRGSCSIRVSQCT